MSTTAQAKARPPRTTAVPARPAFSVKLIGVGHAGARIVDELIDNELPASCCLVLDGDEAAVKQPCVSTLAALAPQTESQLPGEAAWTGGALAGEQAAKVKDFSAGADVVLVVAGLGGRTGTDGSPVVARLAKDAGVAVLAFVTLPFDGEGSHRQQRAAEGFEALRALADGVVCLPNQKVLPLIDGKTPLGETFETPRRLLTDALRGVVRMLTRPSLVKTHLADLCAVLRGPLREVTFATADATGAERAREAAEKLLAHPMLDGGEALRGAEAVIISVVGGPGLTIFEVNQLVAAVNARCPEGRVIVGAAQEPSWSDRLTVTLLASARRELAAIEVGAALGGRAETGSRSGRAGGDLEDQLLPRAIPPRAGSRLVPPVPEMSQQDMQQLLTRQENAGGRGRKGGPRLRQTQLPLELISKGRFDKSEPTIYKGEDLDIPTYVRRGVVLN